jgi:hypothetical protein
MLNLNFYHSFAKAGAYFNISYQLSRKKLQHVPDNAVLEYEMVWLSQYHLALSYFNLKEYEKASEACNEILQANRETLDRHIPMPTKEILAQADELRRKSLQSIKKGEYK